MGYEMNFEQKYKIALSRARRYSEHPLRDDSDRIVKWIFPELEESKSEDDMIRQDIIRVFKGEISYTSKEDANKYIAWLEKHDECSWKPTKEQFEALDYAYNSCSDTERGNYYEGVLEGLIEDLHKLQEKQNNSTRGQSEVTKTSDQELEPKFHPGDWVTHNTANFVFKIINLGSNGYEVVNRENYKKTISFDNEDNYRLWTIDDAKCGDVLISSNNQPFVYNGNYTNDSSESDSLNGNYTSGSLGAYFGLTITGELLICDSHCNTWTDLTGVQPATEEQCNMLFKKLYDSDYKWDSEKKELWHKYL